jgi:dihydropteroate synthase
MQANPTYTDVVAEVKAFLRQRVDELGDTGADVYVDPGIGFGKTTVQNLELLKHLDELAELGPVAVGFSRKRFLGDLMPISTIEDRDRVTTLLHALLLKKPVQICRVHNVRALLELSSLSSSLAFTAP